MGRSILRDVHLEEVAEACGEHGEPRSLLPYRGRPPAQERDYASPLLLAPRETRFRGFAWPCASQTAYEAYVASLVGSYEDSSFGEEAGGWVGGWVSRWVKWVGGWVG